MMIRKATSGDCAALHQVKPAITDAIIEDRLKRQVVGEVDFLVLEKGDKVVGFVLLKWLGKDTHPEYPDIEDLFVKESERGKGYGSELVAECEHRTIVRGFNKIGLAVNPELNRRAKELYEKLGYKSDGRKTYLDGIYNGTEDWCIDLEKFI